MLPQCPHNSFSDNKYSSMALPLDGAAAYLAKTRCTFSNSSSSIMRGMPPSISSPRYMYLPR
ncbi:MAG: hypothetical protein K2N23_00995 [Clostridia bacterium]|nr:hypothetical protein [Clostridia bacterium]